MFNFINKYFKLSKICCIFAYRLDRQNMRFKKFDKSQRSTFSYWFNHWKAYNYTAIKLGHWRFRYLFHDFEKPWLRLWFRGDYKKVQQMHRRNNKHHLEYKVPSKRNWIDMAIDWECSNLTKNAHPYTAMEEADRKYSAKEMKSYEYYEFLTACRKLGLNVLHPSV